MIPSIRSKSMRTRTWFLLNVFSLPFAQVLAVGFLPVRSRFAASVRCANLLLCVALAWAPMCGQLRSRGGEVMISHGDPFVTGNIDETHRTRDGPFSNCSTFVVCSFTPHHCASNVLLDPCESLFMCVPRLEACGMMHVERTLAGASEVCSCDHPRPGGKFVLHDTVWTLKAKLYGQRDTRGSCILRVTRWAEIRLAKLDAIMSELQGNTLSRPKPHSPSRRRRTLK